MTRVLILADDLTGAQDSAAPFAARGLAVHVTLTPGAFRAALAEGVAVISHATGTREMPAAQARARVGALAPEIAGFDGLIFKKIDSRMKGNIEAELAAIPLRGRSVLCSPAIPALGRQVLGGQVVGAGVTTPIPIAERLGLSATIPDVQSDADLLAALPDDLGSTLYVGAAGLGQALATRLAPSVPAPEFHLRLPLLLAIGSRDPITLAQLDALGVRAVPAPNGACGDIGGEVCLVRMTAGPEQVAGPEASARFAAGISAALRDGAFNSLFACGGETAHSILSALGVEGVHLLGEVLPGVPVAQVPVAGLALITKSGGFGEADCLVRLLDKFAESSRKDMTSI